MSYFLRQYRPKGQGIFYEKKKHSYLVTLTFLKPKKSPFNNKNLDIIYLLTNVTKTQDVPLDGTVFFGNTGQRDKTN